MKTTRVALAFVACLSVASHAANGVIEINQARANAGNVTPGDGAGFPVNINTSGSYILTSNLTASAGGLVVTVNNVTIDLNGFSITGTGVGISAAASINVTVKNGTVASMTSAGMTLGQFARVENVRAIGNQSDGIIVGDGSLVANCTASGNGGKGINSVVAGATTLRDNVVVGNGGDTFKTYLLFPYVSKDTNIDTTFSISNSAIDPSTLPTPPNTGNCQATYVKSDTAVATPTNLVSVAAGRTITWSLASGGVLTAAPAGAYSGYAIVECDFPFAHGVAILKDTTLGKETAASLPAYVIKAPRFNNQPESLGN